MATKKSFRPWGDLRRRKKLPHEKPPHSALLTYKVKAIKPLWIRLLAYLRHYPRTVPENMRSWAEL